MTPFWRGGEGYLQERPLANERDKGSRRHWLPGGVGRHEIAFERLKAAPPIAYDAGDRVGRNRIAFERLKRAITFGDAWRAFTVETQPIAFERLKCSQDHPVRPRFVGWNTYYRVGAFEAVLGSLSGCLLQTAKRSRIAFERLKHGQWQLVQFCAFKVGRSVIAFECSKFLCQRGKTAAAHGLEPGISHLSFRSPGNTHFHLVYYEKERLLSHLSA